MSYSEQNQRLLLLEGIRGFAAVYVVLHHLRPIEGHVLDVFFRFGQEAVIVFMLMSGFVIEFSTRSASTPLTFRSYFIRRFRRIYPIFLMSLLLTWAVQRLIPDGAPFYSEQLLGNILMLQDGATLKPGSIVNTFSGNSPLWSLSYEWWFYMMYFPLLSLGSEQRQRRAVAAITVAGAAMFVAYPHFVFRVLMNFSIWWMGVEMARSFARNGRVEFRDMLPTFALGGVLSLLLIANAALLYSSEAAGLNFGAYPWLEVRHVTTAVVMVGAGLVFQHFGFIGIRQVLAPFTGLASISYAVYVFHRPMLRLEAHPWIADQPFAGWLCVGLAFPLAYLAEVKLQPHITRWLRA